MAETNFDNFLTDRNDIIDNAVYQLILTLTDKTEDELEWDMSIIGDVTLAIESVLARHDITICHPYHEEDENDDNSERIPCIDTDTCEHSDCPYKRNMKG